MTIAKRVGQRITSLRKNKGLSQNELAVLAVVDRSFISEIENGKKNVSINILEKIASALGVAVAELLLEGNDSQNGGD